MFKKFQADYEKKQVKNPNKTKSPAAGPANTAVDPTKICRDQHPETDHDYDTNRSCLTPPSSESDEEEAQVVFRGLRETPRNKNSRGRNAISDLSASRLRRPPGSQPQSHQPAPDVLATSTCTESHAPGIPPSYTQSDQPPPGPMAMTATPAQPELPTPGIPPPYYIQAQSYYRATPGLMTTSAYTEPPTPGIPSSQTFPQTMSPNPVSTLHSTPRQPTQTH